LGAELVAKSGQEFGPSRGEKRLRAANWPLVAQLGGVSSEPATVWRLVSMLMMRAKRWARGED